MTEIGYEVLTLVGLFAYIFVGTVIGRVVVLRSMPDDGSSMIEPDDKAMMAGVFWPAFVLLWVAMRAAVGFVQAALWCGDRVAAWMKDRV